MSPKQKKNFAKIRSEAGPSARCISDSGDLYNAERWQGSCEKKSSDCLASRSVLFKSTKSKATRWGLKKQRAQNGRSLNALSHEQLGSCAEFIEANMEFARKKAWDVHKNMKKCQKDSLSNSSDHRTEQHKRKLSHLGQIVIDSGASLHMTSMNEPREKERRTPMPALYHSSHGSHSRSSSLLTVLSVPASPTHPWEFPHQIRLALCQANRRHRVRHLADPDHCQ